MERWSVERWAFSVETSFKNNNSVIVTQWIFCRHFNIHQNDSVSSPNIVLLWVRNFREIVSATKRKPPERVPSLRTPENIECVCQAFVRSPRQSATSSAIALKMSDCILTYLLTPWSRVLLEKLTSKLCS